MSAQLIPGDLQIEALWNRYDLPQNKQRHSQLVAHVADFLARALEKTSDIEINKHLLRAGALLHDIDKNVPWQPDEHHPDAGVRILRELGYATLAELVRTHPLHAILDPVISPHTWEEKLLYLSDKMVKWEIITVDDRFRLWHHENLPPNAQLMLEKTYPLVKKLEATIFSQLPFSPKDVSGLAQS